MEESGNKNDIYWKLLQSKVQEQKIETLFDIFRRQGIEPILIKGWAAAKNYPKPFERISADVDIAVAPDVFSKGQEILRLQSITGVDLHCGLRHLDTVPWGDLFNHSELIKLNNINIRILCPEDHLRILCVHWLSDGGVSKNRLWDIVYAVEHRPPDFKWERCLYIVNKVRTGWITCTIGLAAIYLNLELKGTPLENMDRTIPNWLLKTVEKEWKSEILLKPLHHCLSDRKKFLLQLSKRIPPNPIQATIEMEGEFDNKSRLSYQLKSILCRVGPSLKRVYETLNNDRVHRFYKTQNDVQK